MKEDDEIKIQIKSKKINHLLDNLVELVQLPIIKKNNKINVDHIFKCIYSNNLCVGELINLFLEKDKKIFGNIIKKAYISQQFLIKNMLDTINKLIIKKKDSNKENDLGNLNSFLNKFGNKNEGVEEFENLGSYNMEKGILDSFKKSEKNEKNTKKNIKTEISQNSQNFQISKIQKKMRISNLEFFTNKCKPNDNLEYYFEMGFDDSKIDQKMRKLFEKKAMELFEKMEKGDYDDLKHIKDPLIIISLNKIIIDEISKNYFRNNSEIGNWLDNIENLDLKEVNDLSISKNLRIIVDNLRKHRKKHKVFALKKMEFFQEFDEIEKHLKIVYGDNLTIYGNNLFNRINSLKKGEVFSKLIQTDLSFNKIKKKELKKEREIFNINKNLNELKIDNVAISSKFELYKYEIRELKSKIKELNEKKNLSLKKEENLKKELEELKEIIQKVNSECKYYIKKQDTFENLINDTSYGLMNLEQNLENEFQILKYTNNEMDLIKDEFFVENNKKIDLVMEKINSSVKEIRTNLTKKKIVANSLSNFNQKKKLKADLVLESNSESIDDSSVEAVEKIFVGGEKKSDFYNQFEEKKKINKNYLNADVDKILENEIDFQMDEKDLFVLKSAGNLKNWKNKAKKKVLKRNVLKKLKQKKIVIDKILKKKLKKKNKLKKENTIFSTLIYVKKKIYLDKKLIKKNNFKSINKSLKYIDNSNNKRNESKTNLSKKKFKSTNKIRFTKMKKKKKRINIEKKKKLKNDTFSILENLQIKSKLNDNEKDDFIIKNNYNFINKKKIGKKYLNKKLYRKNSDLVNYKIENIITKEKMGRSISEKNDDSLIKNKSERKKSRKKKKKITYQNKKKYLLTESKFLLKKTLTEENLKKKKNKKIENEKNTSINNSNAKNLFNNKKAKKILESKNSKFFESEKKILESDENLEKMQNLIYNLSEYNLKKIKKIIIEYCEKKIKKKKNNFNKKTENPFEKFNDNNNVNLKNNFNDSFLNAFYVPENMILKNRKKLRFCSSKKFLKKKKNGNSVILKKGQNLGIFSDKKTKYIERGKLAKTSLSFKLKKISYDFYKNDYFEKNKNENLLKNKNKKDFYNLKIHNIIYTIHKNCEKSSNFKINDYKDKIIKKLFSKDLKNKISNYMNIYFKNNKNCNDQCFHFINFNRTLEELIRKRYSHNIKSDLKILNYQPNCINN